MNLSINRKALRESLLDTSLAMPIAWILSYLSLTIFIQLGVSGAFLLSIFQTVILTAASVTRKYFIRIAFQKRTISKFI